MERREFLSVLAAASAAGLHLDQLMAQDGGADPYEFPTFGNASLLHFTDCHAQLLPVHFREPDINLGVGEARGRAPHLVGEKMLKAFGIAPGTRDAHAFTALDFAAAARKFGRVGGFAQLATLVKQLRASRPGALLCDGGDTWQGSATALWTQAQDMVDATLLLGVDLMTLHFECTYGMARLQEIASGPYKDRIQILAQNIATLDFEDPVFPSHVMREINGVPVAVIGQAFPYTPIANPRYMVADWTFGIQEERLQGVIDEARSAGAAAVVLLSHNGMDVDMKLASRVRGLDFILGGHTHDGVPQPLAVKNPGGVTHVTNAGSNGKFLGVLDLDVDIEGKKIRDFRYRLLPVFSDLIRPDAEMTALVEKIRAPHLKKLEEPLAVAEGMLYRRGNFNCTWDQLIVDALRAVQGADIAFSPGFRWGTTVLAGETITRERLMDQVAITYPHATLTNMTGAFVKEVLEDVCDNLFNADPYLQQGGDMVRTGGLTYRCTPQATIGKRITDLRMGGKPIDADRTYKVAGWAPVAEEAAQGNPRPVWDVVEEYLRQQKRIPALQADRPVLQGEDGNPGWLLDPTG